MKRVTAASLFLIGLLAPLPASTALADDGDWYGAIAYLSNGSTHWFKDYSSKTQLIFAIQNWNSSASYVYYSSGRCGAVVSYTTPFESRRQFSTGHGATRDKATTDAINGASSSYKLLGSRCQD